jgi:hypothetical protein
MNDNFAVVLKSDRSVARIYQGTRDEITSWLKTQDDVSAYEIYSPATKTYYSVAEAVTKPEPLFPDHLLQCVPKYYNMNPETEDVVPNGRHLVDGMKVLIENVEERFRPENATKDYEIARLLERNRWAVVSEFEYSPEFRSISFIATYDDGTKVQRRTSAINAWLVKLDSFPDPVLAEEKAAQKYNSVLELVKGAMMEQEQAMLQRRKGSLMPFAEKTARHIVGLI